MPGFLTVVTPPISSALTTLANAKLDINLTTSTDDSLVNLLINRVSAVIASYLGRPLGLQSLTETYRHAYGSPYTYSPYPPGYGVAQTQHVYPLLLSCVPVVAVAAVVEDGATLVAGTDYEVEPKTGHLWRLVSGSRLSWTATTVSVSYTAGFVLPQDSGTRTLPIEIEDAALTMIRSAYFNRGHDPSIIQEETTGVGVTKYSPTNDSSAGVLQQMAPVLAPYRQVIW